MITRYSEASYHSQGNNALCEFLNVWNDLNAQLAQSVVKGVRNVQRVMLSSNPRVGEIKLEEIVDRSIMRKFDESGFIDRLYSVYPAK